MKNNLFLILLFCAPFFLIAQNHDTLTKKEQRIEKRYIHPQSRYISVGGGLGFVNTKIYDPNNFLDNGNNMGNNAYLPQITYEHGLANNWFAEGGYSFYGTGVVYGRSTENGSSSSYSRLAINHNINIGAGYRVIGPKNFHYLNAHGGLFLGVIGKNFPDLPYGFGSLTHVDPLDNSEYVVTQTLTTLHRFNMGAYLGVSAEVRLSKRVRLFAKYTHRFGFTPNFLGKLELTSYASNHSFDDDAYFSVNGGGAFLTGGVKVLINKKGIEKERVINNEIDDQMQTKDKATRRLIKPWVHSIGLSGSSTQFYTSLNKPTLAFRNQAAQVYILPTLLDGLLINYRYTLPKNFFVDGEFVYHQRYATFRYNDYISPSPGANFAGTVSGSYNFKIGGGYQVLGKNNLRLINVHGGIAFGFLDSPLHNPQPIGPPPISYATADNQEGTLIVNASAEATSKAYFGLYLGVSKDVRITKNLYAEAKYLYQYGGWSKLFETELEYQMYDSDFSYYDKTSATTTATGHLFSVGLRWYFER